MTISADFTVNGAANPASHTTSYASAVTLSLASVVGVAQATWTCSGSSHTDLTLPTITLSGVPSGATATFTFPSDPGDGQGRALLVTCQVSDGSNGSQAGVNVDTSTAKVSVLNDASKAPVCVNERLETDGTHGYLVEALNTLLTITSP